MSIFNSEGMMESRFSKLKLLIGRANFEKLKRSKVAVVGMGGVGSYAAEALARAGIGNLLLIDFDDICITNVNRQIHALDNTVGMSKVEVMRDRILLINPEIKIEILKEQYTEENSSIIQSNLDYLVDAIDNVNNKVHFYLG
ncbi:ThiF family adenylyltransferase [Peptococcaceae bacterium]|nr:ThiF family adenylyltransferase [Peptococcaceae bacterium]